MARRIAGLEEPQAVDFGRVVLLIAKPGQYVGMNGPFTLEAGDLLAAVEAFDFVLAESSKSGGVPVYPALKFTHKAGAAAIKIGRIERLWVEGEWLKGEAVLRHPEYGAQVVLGLLEHISLEMDLGAVVYSRDFAAYLSAVAVIDPDSRPAIPGAGVEQLVAEGDKLATHPVWLVAATDTTVAKCDKDEEKKKMEELKAMLVAQGAMLTAFGDRIGVLEASAKASADAAAASAKAAADAAAANLTAASQADAADLTASTAELETLATAGKVTLGEKEQYLLVLAKAPAEGRKALLAGLKARPEPQRKTGATVTGAAGTVAEEEDVPKDPQERLAKARSVMAAAVEECKGDRIRASQLVTAKYPKLFRGEVK